MSQDYKNFILENLSQFFDENITDKELSRSRQATLKIYKSIQQQTKPDREIAQNFDDLKLKIEFKKEKLKQNIDDVFNKFILDCKKIENQCIAEVSTTEPESIKKISNLPFLIESNFDLVNLNLTKIFENLNFFDKNSQNFLKAPNLDLVQQRVDIKAHKFNVQSIKLINQNIVSSGSDFHIKIWDIKSKIFLKRSINIDSHAKLYDFFDTDLTIGCKNGNVLIYDLNKGLLLNKVCGSKYPVTSILNIDKEILVIGDENGYIKFFNKTNCCFILSINAHKKSVLCLRQVNFEEILSSSSDKTIKLWNIESGECLKSYNLHAYAVYCIEKLDEKRFVSCSWDKSIKIWDKETGNCIRSLEGHKGPIRWIEIFENEEILSCSDDGTIKHWIDGKCHKTLTVNSGPLNCFKILKNGQILIGCMNGSIKVWK